MAGQANRLSGLTGSKELVRVIDPDNPERAPRPVCENLLSELREAKITQVYIVIRDGKWDIPKHLGDGSAFAMNIAYLMMGRPFGTPYSIDQAYPFIRHHRVLLGFPDMHFHNQRIFQALIAHQEQSTAEVVLGLFPADRPGKVDMVEVDRAHRIKQINIKPAETNLKYTWGIAIWTPVFSAFMHRFLADHEASAAEHAELFVGDVITAGIEAGLDIQGIQVSNKPFIDIGTADDLRRLTE